MTIGRGSPYVFQSFQIINSKYRILLIIHMSSIYDLLGKVAPCREKNTNRE